MFGARPFGSRPFASALQVLSLTAAKGTFTLTGNAATITSVRHITAAKGTFTLTGFASGRGVSLLASTGTFIVSGTTFGQSRRYPFGANPFGARIFEGNITNVAAAALLVVNRAPPTFTTRRNIAPALVDARKTQPVLFQRRSISPTLIDARVHTPIPQNHGPYRPYLFDPSIFDLTIFDINQYP